MGKVLGDDDNKFKQTSSQCYIWHASLYLVPYVVSTEGLFKHKLDSNAFIPQRGNKVNEIAI